MSTEPTIHFVVPTYRPAGGVVKVMDYVTHALDFGYSVSVQCNAARREKEPLFEIERFRGLTERPDVEFHTRPQLDVTGDDDLVFISLPTNYEMALSSLPRTMSPDRIIHIIQNIRHVNPKWLDGQPLRTLARPASRISINSIVADVVRPVLDPRGLHRVINLGHELSYFAESREGELHTPLRVAYTTWKSAVGDEVAAQLADEPGFDFRAIREHVSWEELRELYRWADVFLSTPSVEEGLYLPGLEAMAAGVLVVTPDVGGNMAYCTPGENCLLVGYDDASGYVAALRRIQAMPLDGVRSMRDAGSAMSENFSLDSERAEFREFLAQVVDRSRSLERATSTGRTALG